MTIGQPALHQGTGSSLDVTEYDYPIRPARMLPVRTRAGHFLILFASQGRRARFSDADWQIERFGHYPARFVKAG